MDRQARLPELGEFRLQRPTMLIDQLDGTSGMFDERSELLDEVGCTLLRHCAFGTSYARFRHDDSPVELKRV